MNPPTIHIKVIVAEDQLIILHSLVILLNTFKHIEVIGTAGNGQQLLKLLEDSRPDVILTDIQMPHLDGFEATRMIRQDTNGKNALTPIIALTANAMKGDKERCIATGMNDYISKPINPEEVFQTIEKYYSK